MSDLIWAICPVKRMYGEGMVETTVAIDNDRTFTLTCHVDDVENVEEIILLGKTKEI